MIKSLLRKSVTARKIAHRVRGGDIDKDAWFEDHYPEWRQRRIDAILEHYGAGFFAGKTLLEVGAGYAEIGAEFAKYGASVTSSDARPEHVAEASRRHPEISVIEMDLDRAGNYPQKHFDILLHLGVLYHLGDPEMSIKEALACADHVVLETEVTDSSDPNYTVTRVEAGYDQAFNNKGSRPSPAFVERILSEAGRPFSRVSDDRLNASYHRYDWEVTDSMDAGNGLRRFWYVGPATSA